MKFPYRLYAVEPSPAAPTRSIVSRPVIPITFSGPAGADNSYALLDTGADESYITASIAERLGVTPLSDAVGTVQSASGQITIQYAQVTLDVTDGAERFCRQIVIGIVGEDWSEAILGHIGFLEYFDATFSHTDQHVPLVQRSAHSANTAVNS